MVFLDTPPIDIVSSVLIWGGTIHYTHVYLYVYKRALKCIYMWFNCIEHL